LSIIGVYAQICVAFKNVCDPTIFGTLNDACVAKITIMFNQKKEQCDLWIAIVAKFSSNY
jgi:hypothetical protein